MRNRISFYKHYLPWTRLSRRAVCLIAALATLTSGSIAAQDILTLPGRPSPRLSTLLLPRLAPAGAYQLTVLDDSLESARTKVMAALAPAAAIDAPSGAWTIRDAGPLDAFGDVGIYDRSKLSRLFAGKAARVLRAPIERGGRVVGSVTLISPHPDADFSRLLPGTLAILFIVSKP